MAIHRAAKRRTLIGFAVATLTVAAWSLDSSGVVADDGAVAPDPDVVGDGVQIRYAAGIEQDSTLTSAVIDRVNARSATLKDQRGASVAARLSSLAVQGRDMHMRVDRESGGWAQGVAYVEAPPVDGAMPEGWVFFAQRGAGGWRAYLEGDAGFASAAAESTTNTSEEQAVYEEAVRADVPASALAASVDTQMQFPVRSASWFYMGSPHGSSGYSGALSSVDISGSDGTVRSARGGNAINMCNGWTRIIHNNGYSTDYYHMNASRQLSGGVGQNVVLGNQGTSTCAGGAAYGNHVHFSLREYDANLNGWYVSLNGKIIGSHRIYTGGYYSGGSTVDVRNGNSGGLPGTRWNY